MKSTYIFALIAFFIILLAAINYMNLSTARSANRSREVGLRKVIGSTKRLLIQQFLLESVVLTLISLIIAVIIVCTIIVYRQIHYMLNKDLGFNKEHLLVIRRADALGKDKIKVFRQEIEKYPGVINSTNSTAVPGYPNSNNGFLIEGRSSENTVLLNVNWTDYDYFDTYKLEMAKGRFISEDFATDTAAAVINESAARIFELDNPLDTRLMQPVNTPDKWLYLKVVGVVKDFNYQALHDSISPHVFLYKPQSWGWGGYITVRISPGNIDQTIKHIEDTWDKFTANDPFKYFFLDEEFNNIYHEEKKTGKLSLGFAVLSVFIAFLALPLAYFIMKGWLQNFYYRINLSIAEFVLSFLIALFIAFLTVFYTVYMEASKNPVRSLQYE